MRYFLQGNRRGLIISLLAHLLLIGLFFIAPNKSKPLPQSTRSESSVKAVEAMVIDAAQLDSELQKLRNLEQHKRDVEQQRVKTLREQAQLAKKQRQREEQRLAEAKRKKNEASALKKKIEKQGIAAEKREVKKQRERKRQAALETKRLQQIKAKQVAVERKRKLEEQRLVEVEIKRKQEEERKHKIQKEVEQQRKEMAAGKLKAEQEAERQRQVVAVRKRKQAEEALRREAERELQAGIAREQQQRNTRLINEYIAAIKSKVQRNWLQYAGNQKGKSCVVRVRLIPGGDVLSVQITRSSGDSAFDQSVEQAVFRAAPLPVPSDPELFNAFRDVSFVFTPGG